MRQEARLATNTILPRDNEKKKLNMQACVQCLNDCVLQHCRVQGDEGGCADLV
jgi:hypothetical protein